MNIKEAVDIIRPEKLGGNDSIDDIEIFWNYEMNMDMLDKIKNGMH